MRHTLKISMAQIAALGSLAYKGMSQTPFLIEGLFVQKSLRFFEQPKQPHKGA